MRHILLVFMVLFHIDYFISVKILSISQNVIVKACRQNNNCLFTVLFVFPHPRHHAAAATSTVTSTYHAGCLLLY